MASKIRELESNELKAVIGGAVYSATATTFGMTPHAHATSRSPLEFTPRRP